MPSTLVKRSSTACMYVYTCAVSARLHFAKSSLLKIFRFASSDESFLHENSLPILTYIANIWHALKVDKNIITQIYLAQKLM